MPTKNQVLENPASCLSKAHGNEPIFILRANDPIASMVIRIWATIAKHTGTHEHDKIVKAVLGDAIEFEMWRHNRGLSNLKAVPPGS